MRCVRCSENFIRTMRNGSVTPESVEDDAEDSRSIELGIVLLLYEAEGPSRSDSTKSSGDFRFPEVRVEHAGALGDEPSAAAVKRS